MPNKNQVLIYGRHAATAAINNPHRKIVKIFCQNENRGAFSGRENNGKICFVDKKELEKMLPREAVHQGVAVLAEMLLPLPLEELCARAGQRENFRVLVLDQVTDPQNVGAIIRSATAFGVDALMVQDKNSPQESGAMLKAAAGTFELLPVCRVTNLSRALEKMKKTGFWIIGTDGYAKAEPADMPKSGRLAVVMGSEGAGLRRLVEETCDITVRLPIDPRVESLNVSTAAAVVLYELSRKTESKSGK